MNMNNAVAVDYETFYSKKLGYTVKKMSSEQYCSHKLFDPYMIAVCDGANSWSGAPKDLNWNALEDKLWLSHNRGFDNTVYNEQVKRGQVPLVRRAGWECTANLTAYLCNRRSLDQAVEHLYKIKVDKGARSDADGKHWTDYPVNERTRMLEYAKGDAVWCHKLWTHYGCRWPQFERDCSNLTIDQGMRGVQINVDLLNIYIMQLHEMKSTTEKLLPWLDDSGDDWDDTGDFADNLKPTSTKCIAEQCRRSKIPCPPVKSREGEEAFEEWEATYGAQHSWIAALSSWRSINKMYGMVCVIKERLRPDGSLAFGSKYFGAHTGRVSGEQRVNMYNMRKLPVICTTQGLMEMNERRVMSAVDSHAETEKWPEWVRYAIDFRYLIIPRAGKKMIISDLSQIEPRILAWLSGDRAMLKLLETGMSIYEAHARTKMGWTGGNLKKENAATYALAKANVLALGYQAGWQKYIIMAYNYTRLDITADDPEWVEESNPFTGEITRVSGYGHRARATVRDFRASNKPITDLWNKLDCAFKQSIGSDFVLTLPSGRRMVYEDVRCSTRIVANKETGKPERKSEFTAVTGGKRVAYYGGKLTENATQATARDVFMEHTLAMERNGWNSLFGVYDESVLEVDKDVTVCDVENAMSQTPEWMPGLPVGAEAHESPCYKK